MEPNSPEIIREVLTRYRKVTIVGLSPDRSRPSHEIAEYLVEQGFDVSGVRPGVREILGCPVYESVDQVPGQLEIVDVFRDPQHVPALVEQLIPLKPKALWLQLGITHPEAEQKAREAGITVISDRCMLVEFSRISC